MTPGTKNILLATLSFGVAGALFYWWKSSQKVGKTAEQKLASFLPAGGQVAQSSASFPNNSFDGGSQGANSGLFTDASNISSSKVPVSSVGSMSRMVMPSWRQATRSTGVAAAQQVPSFSNESRLAYESITHLIEMSYQSPCSVLQSSSPLQPKQLGPFAGLNEELQAAISHYQAAHNMPVTGQPDADTLANLVDYTASLMAKCSGKYPQSFRVIV